MDGFILAPVERNGLCGGQMRLQHTYLARLDSLPSASAGSILSDGAGRAPGVWKTHEAGEDGRVYAFKL